MPFEYDNIVHDNNGICFAAQTTPPKSDIVSSIAHLQVCSNASVSCLILPVLCVHFSLDAIFHSAKSSVVIFRKISVTWTAAARRGNRIRVKLIARNTTKEIPFISSSRINKCTWQHTELKGKDQPRKPCRLHLFRNRKKKRIRALKDSRTQECATRNSARACWLFECLASRLLDCLSP